MRHFPAVLVVILGLILTACGGDDPSVASEVARPEIRPTEVVSTVNEEPTLPAPVPQQETAPVSPGVPDPTATPAQAASQAPPPGVIAEVNGVAIPMAEFQRQLTDMRAYLLSEGLVDPSTEEGRAALNALRQQVLNQLIDQLLIVQSAEQMGLTVTDEEVDASIASIKEDMASEEAFAASLAANRLTEETFREVQRQQLLSRKVMDKVTGDIPSEMEQVHARHILVESREEAEAILKQLERGADFAELARQFSVDETTKDNGGDLGFFPRGFVLPEFEEAAFSLDVGQRSGVVETPFGFHIIEVLARETRPIPEEIAGELRQQAVMNWLDIQRAQADIRRYVDWE